MAAVREEQGKFQEAEAIYRELLQKNKQFVPALNNLAVLLALGGRQLDEARDLIESAVALEGPNSSSTGHARHRLFGTRRDRKGPGRLERIGCAGGQPPELLPLGPRSAQSRSTNGGCRLAQEGARPQDSARGLAPARAPGLRRTRPLNAVILPTLHFPYLRACFFERSANWRASAARTSI